MNVNLKPCVLTQNGYFPQMRRRKWLMRCAMASTLSLLSIGTILPATAQTNLITNGSFEQGVDTGSFVTLYTGSTDIVGWEVVDNNIDYKGSYCQASHGQRSIDLAGSPGIGSIGQSLDTETGKQYQVLFDMAGNPGDNRKKYLTISAGANSQDFSFDTAGHDRSQMGWLEKSFVFTAAGEKTRLIFTGLHEVARGAMIDNVRVFPVRRETSNQPDLTVTTISTAKMHTDIQSLQISGDVEVVVENLGTATEPALVTLFEDTNSNGLFDSEADNILGAQLMPTGLATDETLTIAIPVNGRVAFRDSPIYALVDSEGTLDETNEDNNVLSTAHLCKITADDRVTFEPVLKWAWTGSSVLPSHNQVMHTPVVAPLEDTNSDGKINQLDTPSVIFHTYSSTNYNADGVLRAVSGKDGHELWTVSNPAYRTLPAGSIAVADLDNDGIIEIIAPKNGGGLIAFEHTGKFKWQSTINVFVRWGGPSIADLDGDGSPEIVVGNTALNADGTLRWQGNGFTGSNGVGPLSIVADINLDGSPEVVAGAAAYSNTGKKLWQNDLVGEGFVALGNFNKDDYPEIAIISSGEVFLLDHNGEIIWGPISIPGGGRGGAPTVADMNGDGVPEIGVAGASQYAVFKADSSVLWATTTVDNSSNVTGSSVFDFDGDGQVEVVYADQYYVRVYRGKDGAILFEVPNTSGTTYELPVIADVDNDNHADVIICANQLLSLAGYAPGINNTGVYVFQDKYNSWVNTRKIWNQHSYHVTNINDDGTVPAIEQPSWLMHNTYRLNTLNTQSAEVPTFAVPDLTASQLQNNGDTLSVLIGNAGLVPVPAGVKLRFYENNPIDSDKVLGEFFVDELAPNTSQEISLSLENVKITEGAALYAFVDADEVVGECNEYNNTAWYGRALETIAPASCQFYALNDKDKNKSQLAVFNIKDSLDGFTKTPLGTQHNGYDLEGLALNPNDNRLYLSSGDDVGAGQLRGHLYTFDAKTGALIPIGPTGFEEVDSLVFAPDGTLYGWAKEVGLIKIDPATGFGTLVVSSELAVEDLTIDDNNIFYASVNTELWRYDAKTDSQPQLACDNLPGEVESMQTLPDNLFLLGLHGSDFLRVFEIQACKTFEVFTLPTDGFEDTEGFAIPINDCPLAELIKEAAQQAEAQAEPKPDMCLSYDGFKPGDSVEGWDTLYPGVNLSTSGQAVFVKNGKGPKLYVSNRKNNCIGEGFGDKKHIHDYTFTLKPGMNFSDFSLKMVDFGDINPKNAAEHFISLVAYDVNDNIVSVDNFSYSSKGKKAYRDGEFLGKIDKIGNACKAKVGDVGNYRYRVTGANISTIKLLFLSYNNKTSSKPSDPNFAINEVCFTTTEASSTPLSPTKPEQGTGPSLFSNQEFMKRLNHGLAIVGENPITENVHDEMSVMEESGKMFYTRPDSEQKHPLSPMSQNLLAGIFEFIPGAQKGVLHGDGRVFVTVNTIVFGELITIIHQGELSHEIKVSSTETVGKLELKFVADRNGDGIGDLELVYPDGATQTLLYFGGK